MRLTPLFPLLLASLVILCSGAENGTKPVRKTLKMVKALKKSSSKTVKAAKAAEVQKSESYHVPIIVSAPSALPHHLPPVSVEIHDDDRHLKSAHDIQPIKPIHLLPTRDDYPGSRHTHYSPYPEGDTQPDYIYKGPVAVPVDYPYGNPPNEDHYESTNRVSPGEYYSESYGDLSAIPGSPGIDYPTYSHLPTTGFKCLDHTSTPGFYADVETKCQMWHYCQPDGRHDRFLCPNGTVFDQMTRVCNWWFNVYCDSSISHYDINFDLYREPLRLSALPQTLDHHSHQSIPSHSEPYPITQPNSFLGHLEDFEAKADYGSYHSPLQSAASPQVHRYPIKMAPSPKVRHDIDNPIVYESSNAHTQSTPSDTLKEKLQNLEKHTKKALKKRKRISRRKQRKHPKIYSKPETAGDDIPIYKEPKATPAARRYRVVRRRKVNKTH